MKSDNRTQDDLVGDLAAPEKTKGARTTSRYVAPLPSHPKISDLSRLLTQVQAGKKIDTSTDQTLLKLYGMDHGYTVKGRLGQLFISPGNLRRIIEKIFDAQVQRIYSDA